MVGGRAAGATLRLGAKLFAPAPATTPPPPTAAPPPPPTPAAPPLPTTAAAWLEHSIDELRAFDREPTELRGRAAHYGAAPDGAIAGGAAVELFELPVRFAPTYMRTPSAVPTATATADGGAEAARVRYSLKRCPAWTDRVLMDRGGWDAVRAAAEGASYTSHVQPPGSCTCDHDMVTLSLAL